MGAGASTNVKTISIDQSDEQWQKYHGSLHGASNGSSRSISAVGDRIRKGAGAALGSRASSADRRYQQLRGLYETTEKKCSDAEQQVRNLQRELSTIELRNSELASEVAWLKQQIGCPEMPIPDEPISLSVARVADANSREQLTKDKETISRLQTKLKKIEGELVDVRSQLQRDTHAYKTQLQDVINEFEAKIDSLQESLSFENRLNLRMEEMIRREQGDDAFLSLRNEALTAKTVSPKQPTTRSHVKSHLILEMNCEINEKNTKIKRLEEALIFRDREIDELKSQLNLSSSMRASTIHVRKPPNASVALIKAEIRRPMSVDSSVGDNYEQGGRDEITALLETPEPKEQLHISPSPPLSPAIAVTTAIEEPRDPAGPEAPEFCKANRRVLSSLPKKMEMKNIFSFSEAMEPIRMEDELPRTPIGPRPATADTVRSSTPNNANTRTSNSDKHQNHDSRVHASTLGRGFSAPTLFKPSKSRSNRRGRHSQQAVAPCNGDCWDLQSIYGDQEPPTPAPTSDDLPPVPPPLRGGHRGHRSLRPANNKVMIAVHSSDDDDYVDDILNESVPNFSVFMSKTSGSRASSQSASHLLHRESPGSAKSRDSGYLGESSLLNESIQN